MSGRRPSVIAALTARRAVRGGGAWGAVFALVLITTVTGYTSAYPTLASRRQLAATLQGNTGLQALFGVTRDISTVKGFTGWRSMGFLPLLGGIWALLHATRSLRGEEESGRLELALAGATTRVGATVSAIAGLATGASAMFLATAAGALAVAGVGGYSVGAALFLAVALVAAPVVFLAAGTLTSQLAGTRRQAAALAGGAFGACYAVRLAADSGTDLRWLRWASPLGWVEALHPLSGSDPLPLVPIVALTLVLGGLAVALAAARDYGSGTLRTADTAEPRTLLLTGPWRLSVRLTRSRAATWAAALSALAAVVGLVAKSVGEATSESDSFARIIQRLGGQATGSAAYLGLSFSILAALLAFQAGGHVAATREEESEGYVDNLLVRPVARTSWLLGRVAAAFVALLAVAVLTGLATWVTAASQGTGVSLPRLLLAGVNILPPAVLVLGAGTLAHAAVPRRAVALTYGLVGGSYLVELVGSLVNASHWVLDLSIFHHLAPVPAVDPRWAAAAAFYVLGIAAVAVALAVVARRDIVGA